MITYRNALGQEIEIRDFFGKEVNVGDEVIYAPASTSCRLQRGIVVQYPYLQRRYDRELNQTVYDQFDVYGIKMKNGHKRRINSWNGSFIKI